MSIITIESILRKEVVVERTACRIIGVTSFVILTSLGAFIRIPLPFTPVPLTLQTFFVLLSGAMLGANLGSLSQLIYLILGLAGIPIFANAGSGLLYLFGPTGGYILGFVFASFFMGRAIRSLDRITFPFVLLFMCIGDLIILFFGIFWLKFLFGYELNKIMFIGLLPFIPGDLLKIIFASSIFLKTRARLKKIFY